MKACIPALTASPANCRRHRLQYGLASPACKVSKAHPDSFTSSSHPSPLPSLQQRFAGRHQSPDSHQTAGRTGGTRCSTIWPGAPCRMTRLEPAPVYEPSWETPSSLRCPTPSARGLLMTPPSPSAATASGEPPRNAFFSPCSLSAFNCLGSSYSTWTTCVRTANHHIPAH